MAASVAGRSRLVLALCRASRSSSSSFSAARSFSIPSRPSSFVRHRSPVSPLLRLGRRELSSLQPLHSAIASACLVSKLPSEASTSTEVQSIASWGADEEPKIINENLDNQILKK